MGDKISLLLRSLSHFFCRRFQSFAFEAKVEGMSGRVNGKKSQQIAVDWSDGEGVSGKSMHLLPLHTKETESGVVGEKREQERCAIDNFIYRIIDF